MDTKIFPFEFSQIKFGKRLGTQQVEKRKSLNWNQARRRGGSKGSNEPPLEVNNGGLKTQTVDF